MALTLSEIKIRGRKYYPAILLDQFLRYKTRLLMRRVSFFFMIGFFMLMIVAGWNWFGLGTAVYYMRGAFLIAAIVWFKGYLIEAFYLSHYFREGRVEFEVAKLAYRADRSDLTGSFLESVVGEYLMDKLGITEREVKMFLKDEDRTRIREQDVIFEFNARQIPNDDKRVINLPDYAHALYKNDEDFRYFLQKNNVDQRDFFGALSWAQDLIYKIREANRFFSRERLSRIPSLGRNWYIEEVDYLKKYSHLIYENNFYQSLGKDWYFFRDEAEQVEDLLIDTERRNIMIIAEKVSTGMQVVATFGKMIANGICTHGFENKKMFVLNPEVLMLHNDNKEEFQETLFRLSEQATNTKDIIIVLQNLPDIIKQTTEAGLDFIELFEKVLRSTDLPFIVVAKKSEYYQVVEPYASLVSHFDKYVLPNIDEDFLLKILEDEAMKIEQYDGKEILFPVLRKIADKYSGQKGGVKKALVELHRIYQ
jgi:hypothetical protein